MLRVLDIAEGTIVDGPGLRTSIYFAGCTHHCPGCHNPQSWDPAGGREMSVDELMKLILDNEAGVTFSGGDPLLQIDELLPLAAAVKEARLSLWVYTGYTIEQVRASESLRRILAYADALVEGPFLEAQRDTTLQFRGSRNQRIVLRKDF